MEAAMTVATCLWFDHDAEAAARFYCSLLPGSAVTRVFPALGDPKGRAFMVEFDLMGQRYQAMNGGPHYVLNPAASIVVAVETQAEIDRLWAALLQDGGRESRCGWLTDRWGLSWQILPQALMQLISGDASGRVAQAMMAMVKMDIAGLEAAAGL
jgi:predicted 3-demethylubiquinone-9 3-methyltransferase (glyoxalase superfamily)